MNTYDVKDIAGAFLCKSALKQKKLQKLVYYAHAWHLYFCDNKPFSNEEFQAWVHGPVSPKLYNQYRDFGYKTIPQLKECPQLDEERLSIIDAVWESYGHLTGDQLEALTHAQKPWQNARKGYKPYEAATTIISKQDMLEYCQNEMSKTQDDV